MPITPTPLFRHPAGSDQLQLAHEERRELVAEVRRDAGFKAGRRAVVVALDDVTDFMQPGDNARLLVRNG